MVKRVSNGFLLVKRFSTSKVTVTSGLHGYAVSIAMQAMLFYSLRHYPDL
jgi:hypothetical protein